MKKIIITLLLSTFTLLSATENYKIVVASYNSLAQANQGLEKIKNVLDIKPEYREFQKKYFLQLHARKLGNYFVVSVEALPGKEVVKNLLSIVQESYPSSFIKKFKNSSQADQFPSYERKKKVNVNFADLEIEDFINLISKMTKKNILMNNQIKGKVNFVSNSPVYEDELMDIMISVLESKGFTLVENGSLLEVVRSTEAAKHNAKVRSTGEHLDGSIMVTQSIKIKGENVDVVAAKVRYLISKTAKLMTMKESNTLLITDYPDNIETIKQVIEDLIADGKNIVKIVKIKYAEVQKLQKRLVEITNTLFNQTVANEKVKIIHDDNTNGIIVVGKRENVRKVESLIEELDVESNTDNTVHIFHLKNSDSKAVLATINDIVSKNDIITKKDAAGKMANDPSAKPSISASEEINAIIVVGSPIFVKSLKRIIDELDKEKYQVYVKARIVEISQSDAENLGIKYGFAAGDVSSSGLYAMSANFGAPDLTSSAFAAATEALGTIGTNTASVFALGATIDFLETNGASKSLSNPSILCVNNKESSIYVGKTISVEAASVSTTLTTGLSKSYKREDVGLTLKIKPRVSSVDKVTLDVEAILENILANDANNQPVTSKQEVKTQAILRHGESIIIGGLVKNYNTSSETKVPLLGDIPLVGEALFTSQNDSEQEDNLVIILTPYIVDKSENLSKLQRKLGLLANLQKKYNLEVFDKIKQNSPQKESESKVDSFESFDLDE